MSLIKCPECGAKVSDKAQTCIHCGFPLSGYIATQYVNNVNKNTKCNINGIELDLSDVAAYMQEWENDKAMKRIVDILDQSELDISIYSKINFIAEIMKNFRIPETYEILSNEEYFEQRLKLEANNTTCYIHYIPYDFSSIKEQVDKFGGVTLSGCKTIRKIQQLNKSEADNLIIEINKYEYIPLSFPEDFDNVYPKLIMDRILDDLANRYDEMHPEQVEPSNSQEPAQNVPQCPTCHSTNIECISSGKKTGGFLGLGVLNSNFKKTFKCNNCGYKW